MIYKIHLLDNGGGLACERNMRFRGADVACYLEAQYLKTPVEQRCKHCERVRQTSTVSATENHGG